MAVKTGERTGPFLRFRFDFWEGFATARGLTSVAAKADFLGISDSNYRRLATRDVGPGEVLIAKVLAKFAREGLGFDVFFELVAPDGELEAEDNGGAEE